MNMTVLFKKCTYGLLLITTTIIGLVNFGYCLNEINVPGDNFVAFEYDISEGGHSYIGYRSYSFTVSSNTLVHFSQDYDMVCIRKSSQNQSCNWSLDGVTWYGVALTSMNCFGTDEEIYLNGCNPVYSYYFSNGDPLLPKLTSLECQTEYNLIPISSVDQNYCVNNNLCPSSECPEIPEGTGNWSALYINNIQYNGTPTIRVTIPEEIEREQYTDEEETNIDVIGYGYDQDKMQQMVNTQYYKPTAEEMSGLIEKIADFLPLIAVALLITRLRRVIKKVF